MKKMLSLVFVLPLLFSCGANNSDNYLSDSNAKDSKKASKQIENIKVDAVKTGQKEYFSSTSGAFTFTYSNKDFPSLSKVSLHYGLQQKARSYDSEKFDGPEVKDWQSISTKEMTAVKDADGVWAVDVSATLAERTSNYTLDAIQFVFVLETESGKYYDKGNVSPLGYYEVDATALRPSDTKDIPLKVDGLKVKAVEKDYDNK